MAFGQKEFLKFSGIGAVLGILGWIIGLGWNLITNVGAGGIQASLNLPLLGETLKQQIQLGVPTTLADKVIGWLNGLPFFDLGGLFTLAIGGALIAVIGAVVLSFVPAKMWITKTPFRRLVSIAVVGTFVSGWIAVLFSGGQLALPELQKVIVMIGYFIIVAFAYGGLARMLKGTKARKLFVEA